MKIRYTVQSPVPLSFIAEVATNEDAWRLLAELGRKWPVTHEIETGVGAQCQDEAEPWPEGV